MYISSNRLKKYIKNSDKINWLSMWNSFTIHSAEIDGIEIKGKDINKVVVAQILELNPHKTNNKYNIVKLNVGNEILQVVSSATNLYVGMKVPCALIGGCLKGLSKVESINLDGEESNGVLASEKELGISDNHTGVMDLDKSYEIGRDIKEYIPIDDIVIEIDNKSLTNRPDMWGHYGIAREVCAITDSELLPLELIKENLLTKEDKIKVTVLDDKNCNRYSCIKVSNIKEKSTDIEMKTFLYYCGMRSISLLVDLTNYLMLELGQPMHAFDSNKIDEVVVKNVGNEKINFTTLDGIEREIPENTLMICNKDLPVAIAGIMGGLNSGIEEDTTSLILESANFDSTSIRKSAIALGLRTDASAHYEKSLDPNMTVTAIKRFLYLLKNYDNNISIDTGITDVYPNKIEEKVVELSKDMLRKYMGFVLDDDKVISILESLEFKVENKEDKYIITVPTFRATKDISMDRDIIEEIARIYGYDKLEVAPLKLDLVINNGEGKYELEYDIKKYIAEHSNYHEIHTYLWYQTNILNKYNINKENNVKLVNKNENNIIRDDLSWSLYEQCLENSKHTNKYGVFELGSMISREKEERVLSILDVCDKNTVEERYSKLKKIIYDVVKHIKNKEITYRKSEIEKDYLDNNYSIDILLDNKKIGYISLLKNTISKDCGKKTLIINAELWIENLYGSNIQKIIYEEPSKYPITNIDYTFILNKETKYEELDNVLKIYNHKYLLSYNLIDIYEDEKKKVTITFVIGSKEKTLSKEDMLEFQENILNYIKNNNLEIVQ